MVPNGTIQVTVSYFYFAEIYGVALISLQRLLSVCFPLSAFKEVRISLAPFRHVVEK